jgi:hypothetical protein
VVREATGIEIREVEQRRVLDQPFQRNTLASSLILQALPAVATDLESELALNSPSAALEPGRPHRCSARGPLGLEVGHGSRQQVVQSLVLAPGLRLQVLPPELVEREGERALHTSASWAVAG